MVAITVIYIVATIAICKANIKSAYVSKAQVFEAKR